MPRTPKKYHYIYKTTNLINGKFYVGMHSTNGLDDDYIGSGKYLWNSIRKYGRENFVTEKLEFFESREKLIERERNLVDDKLLKEPMCMNLLLGGTGLSPGHKLSEVTKQKLSEWNKNNPHSKESRIKQSKTVKDKVAAGQKWGMFTDAAIKKVKKPVLQYKDGILIRTWTGVIDIATEFPDLCLNHISNCCRGVRKTHGGFTWKYKNAEDVIKYKDTASKNKRENSNITRDRGQAEELGLPYERFLELRKQKTRFDKWNKFLTNKIKTDENITCFDVRT